MIHQQPIRGEPLNQPRLKPEVKAKWTAALRSGKYKQGYRQLRVNQYVSDERGILLPKEKQTYHYCCLGVLADLAVAEGVCTWDDQSVVVNGTGEKAWDVLPLGVVDWAFDLPENYDSYERTLLNSPGVEVHQGDKPARVMLATLNDGSATLDFDRHNFDQIAEAIDRDL